MLTHVLSERTALVDSQTDRQRTNDLWRKVHLNDARVVSSLTYSVFIRLLALSLPLSLHHLSLTHLPFLSLFHLFSSLLSPSLRCRSVFYTIQVLAVEGDRMKKKKTGVIVKQIAAKDETLKHWKEFNLSLTWILLHVSCHCSLPALHLFIS